MDVPVKKKSFLLALLGATVAAGLTFGVSPAMAVPAVDQIQSGLTGSTVQSEHSIDGNATTISAAETGNSFTAGVTGLLTSIVVPYSSYSSGFPAFDAAALVYTADGSGLPSTPVAFQSIPASSITGGTLTINFTTPATVTAGTRYVFIIAFDPTGVPGPTSNTLFFRAGPAPADKRAVYTGMLTPYVDGANGINFTTYVDASSSSGPGVPAPGPSYEKLADTGANESVTSIWFGVSAGLLAGGVLALVTVRRRLARK